MSGKIRQRGALAIIIYFLMMTAIWAPIGFYAGKAQGETQARAATGAGSELSLFGTDASDPTRNADAPHLYAPIVFLPEQTEPIRLSAARDRAIDGSRRDATLRQTPLREAVLRALASDAASAGATDASSADDASQQPFSLAMAPGLSGLGGGQGPALGGAAPGGNGYPGAIIPGFLAAATPPPPGGEPPMLATPIPAALPMFLGGLAACWTAARRKRSR
ncbi:hypothetical protein [Hyphococcus sp.]|uniref:hypothetical protein n=1 Tax=Hyphococcus sp. TaxID=2038636 RepID=UPI003751CD6E